MLSMYTQSGDLFFVCYIIFYSDYVLFYFLEYYFSTREDMQKGIDNGEFIEWAEYSANLYGTRYAYQIELTGTLQSW